MKSKFTTLKALAAMLVLLSFGLFAWAGTARIAYQDTRGSTGTTQIHTGVSAVQSAGWAAPLNPYYTRGNPNIGVAVGSTAEGSTVAITVGLYHYDSANGTYYFLGLSDVKSVTISASHATETAGEATATFVPEDYMQFETNGANVFDLRISTISAGTVGVRAWGVGVDPVIRAVP